MKPITLRETVVRRLTDDGHALDAAAIDRIAEQYQRLHQMAELLLAVPLSPEDEPAPVFVPRTSATKGTAAGAAATATAPGSAE